MTDTTWVFPKTIGIIGGTGKEGKGLAYRWSKAGIQIVIGSRQLEKAQSAAQEVNSLLGKTGNVEGMVNEQAAQVADLIVLTVPFAAHTAMCEMVKPYAQGKIVIDVTVPLVPPKITRVQMPPEGSATQQAQRILGDQVQVIAAFQNISYDHLLQDEPINCDVIVCGGTREAREVVIELVKAVGLIGWNGGPVENAVVVEGLTSILIGLNKQYSIKDAGIRITSIPQNQFSQDQRG